MSGVPRDDWVALQPHGTRAAYRRHLRHGEPACESCIAAERRGWEDRGEAFREARAEKRRQRYWQARAAGLSAREAKRWKDIAS